MQDQDPSTNLTTEQVKENNKNNNPTGKGGFADHPEHRNPGGWDPKNTFSYQMNRFKNMTITELEEWNKNTPKNERTVAMDLAFKRVFNAQTDLNEYREVADRTEGKAPQTIFHEGGFFSTEKLIIEEVPPRQSEEVINKSDDISTTEQQAEADSGSAEEPTVS